MKDTQEKLGNTLLKGLVSLREQKGGFTLEDVGEMFLSMAENINPSLSAAEKFTHQEISRLAKYISDAKTEIFSISSNEKTDAALTDASHHLDEVIRATEEASTIIMDAADVIQGAVGGVGGEKEQQIMDATNRIYEACNFQDITGQRITKVIKLIENIDERIEKLNELFGAPTEDHVVKISVDDERSLLNGPQLSGQAASQADIDSLFDQIGNGTK